LFHHHGAEKKETGLRSHRTSTYSPHSKGIPLEGAGHYTFDTHHNIFGKNGSIGTAYEKISVRLLLMAFFLRHLY
jgi:hypothetical protein